MPYAAALSTASDFREAAEEVCAEVIRQAIPAPFDLAVIFYSPHHAEAAGSIARQIHGTLQPRKMMGCLGESIIGQQREIEENPALSLWLGNWNGKAELEAFHLQMSETSEGIALLGWPDGLLEVDPARSLLITLGDPYTFPAAEVFLPVVNKEYPGLAVVGGMASNPGGPGSSSLVLNGEVIADGAVGVLLKGSFSWRSVVSQGCRPIGKPLIVTRGQDNIIAELGGQIPLDYLRSLYGQLPEHDRQLFEKGLLLGVAMTEYRETFGRGDFLIRNLLGIDRDSGGISINDRIRVGQTVQFQVRDATSADEDLHLLLQAAKLVSSPVRGGLIFSCNGRGTRMFPDPNHDAGLIQRHLGPIPLAGFFAAGELGPVGGKNFIHGFTASAVFFE